MGRFDERATMPARGPADMLKWKIVDAIAGRNRKDPGGFQTPRREPDRALIAGGAAHLTWIGHASFLARLGGKTFLFDPIFTPRMGPIARLVAPGLALEELPPIDVVVISHNHRDHLDEWTVKRLGSAPRYVVPLGNGDVLRKCGATKIDELDWWQSIDVGGAEVTIVPARHWSMRFPWDRNDALWGGVVVRAREGAAYHSGDTAFFDGFAEIGRRLGAIDWAMLPIGAYEPRWFMEPQHMCPEEAVEAFDLLGARALVAMHWGTFKLTDEPIAEPPERARAHFAKKAFDAKRELWMLDVGETRLL